MEKEKIVYKDKEYFIRRINGIIFANNSLQEELLDQYGDIPIDEEAEVIDRNISSYIDDENFENLDDEHVWELYNNKPMIDVRIGMNKSEVIIEDITPVMLDKWFVNLNILDKRKILDLAQAYNWLNISFDKKIMLYNTFNQ